MATLVAWSRRLNFFLGTLLPFSVFALSALVLWSCYGPAPRITLREAGGHRVVAFSPNGWQLATLSANEEVGPATQNRDIRYTGYVQVWDAETGGSTCKLPLSSVEHKPFRLPLSNGEQNSLFDQVMPVISFSPDGRYLAALQNDSAPYPHALKLLDTVAGQVRTIHRVFHHCFSADGRQLALVTGKEASHEQELHIVATEDGREVRQIAVGQKSPEYPVFWVAHFLSDGRTLVFASNVAKDQMLIVWDIPQQRERFRVGPIWGALTAVSPDGKTLATASQLPLPIRLWDIATGEKIDEFEDKMDDDTQFHLGVKFNFDGRRLSAYSYRKGGGGAYRWFFEAYDQISSWDLTSRQILTRFETTSSSNGPTPPVSYEDPNGAFLPEYTLQHWANGRHAIVDVATGNKKFVVPVADGQNGWDFCWYTLSPNHKNFGLWAVDRHRNKNFLIEFVLQLKALILDWGSKRDWVRCWDIDSGEEIASLPDCRLQFAFSPDGRSVATHCSDGTIKIWDLPARKPLGAILGWSGLAAGLVLFAREVVRWRRHRHLLRQS